jgi:hypothetical protein
VANRGSRGTGTTLKNDPDAFVAGLPRREYMRLAAKARRMALDQLGRRHKKEFYKLLDEMRVEVGLDPRDPNRSIPRKWA